MLEAANIIYNLDYDHDNILSVLEKKVQRNTDMSHTGGKFGGDYFDEIEDVNGDTKYGYLSRKNLESQLHTQTIYRDRVFLDFKKILRSEFQSMGSVVLRLAKKIGKEIPVTEALSMFVTQFSQIKSVGIIRIQNLC